jgi:hypothetical protein
MKSARERYHPCAGPVACVLVTDFPFTVSGIGLDDWYQCSPILADHRPPHGKRPERNVQRAASSFPETRGRLAGTSPSHPRPLNGPACA